MIARDLKRRFRLQTADPAIRDALGYLACEPEIVGPEPRDVHVTIVPARGCMHIVEDGVLLREVLTPAAAMEVLHMHLFGCSMADQPTAAVLHAACLRRHGRRVLLAGTKGAGKSTLTARLVEAGFEFEGDEHVFIEHGNVTPRPRSSRIKEASLGFLPKFQAAIAASPYYESPDGERIFNVNPRALGSSTWRIERGPVDAVVTLNPNHGGYSSIRPIKPSVLMQFLIPESGWRERDRHQSVGTLAALAGRVRAFDLSLGEIAGAIRCIEQVMAVAKS